MIITNLNSDLLPLIKADLTSSVEVKIACGYMTAAGFSLLQPELDQFICSSNKINLILGMAYFEGLTRNDHAFFRALDHRFHLSGINTLRVAYMRPYHGKLYIFKRVNGDYRIYLGSSNTSPRGLASNIECNVLVHGNRSHPDVRDLLLFFNRLNRSPISEDYGSVAMNIGTIIRSQGGVRTRRRRYLATSGAHLRYLVLSVSVNPRSGLNWDRGTRNWYEAYIPVPMLIQRSGFFPPTGQPFDVITDDGQSFQCKLTGTGGKNLTSHPTLDILGGWLKGTKLGAVGLLPGQTVTEQHLRDYGRSDIAITRLSPLEYYFDFS